MLIIGWGRGRGGSGGRSHAPPEPEPNLLLGLIAYFSDPAGQIFELAKKKIK